MNTNRMNNGTLLSMQSSHLTDSAALWNEQVTREPNMVQKHSDRTKVRVREEVLWLTTHSLSGYVILILIIK